MAKSAEELDALVRQARTAAAGGAVNTQELWRRVLDARPEHPEALLALGSDALMTGSLDAATELLKAAIRVSPKDPTAQLVLSGVLRQRGDAAGELAALDAALTIDPYFFLALLQKGFLLDRLGRRPEAALALANAIKIAPPPANLSAEVRGALAQASKVVADNAAALGAHLERRLAELRRGMGATALERFDHTVNVMLGRKKAYLPRPAKLNFQGLPAVQFFDRAHFPWLASIEAATDSIRAELAAALAADRQDFRAYIDLPAGMPVDQWAELDGSERWSGYFLWRDGLPVDAHQARCPDTIAALNAASLFDVPGLGPAAMFSALAPKTRIPPHVGDVNVRAVTHLALEIPEGCGFRVGNDVRQWQAGHAWIFDDTFEHEAWNDSDRLRVILIFDVWNPFLSAAEKDAVRELLAGIAAYTAGAA